MKAIVNKIEEFVNEIRTVILPANSYKGLVATTIKVCKVESNGAGELQHGDTVTFNENFGNEKLVFLKNIEQTEDSKTENGQRTFRAEYVSGDNVEEAFRDAAIEEFGQKIGQEVRPMLCIHGWTLQPGEFFTLMKDGVPLLVGAALHYFKEEKTHYPIPVLWANNRNRNFDQDVMAIYAGEDFIQGMANYPLKNMSLLAHSMGNQMLFNGGCDSKPPKSVKFDNIFLVAADIPKDVFSENPIEVEFKNTKTKAQNLAEMLKAGGKIYVMHTKKDIVLDISRVANDVDEIGALAVSVGAGRHVDRLGFVGADLDKIQPSLKDVVENKDVSTSIPFTADLLKRHNYVFEPFAVKFYKDPLDNID